jgi:hypothetical protein
MCLKKKYEAIVNKLLELIMQWVLNILDVFFCFSFHNTLEGFLFVQFTAEKKINKNKTK